MEAPLCGPFSKRRMKMLSRPHGFILYGQLGVDLSISKFPYPNMQTSVRLIRARLIFLLISDNPNACVGIVDCSLYTRRFFSKMIITRKEFHMLRYFPVEFKFLETSNDFHHSGFTEPDHPREHS